MVLGRGKIKITTKIMPRGCSYLWRVLIAIVSCLPALLREYLLVSTFSGANFSNPAHASSSREEFTHINWEGQGCASFLHSIFRLLLFASSAFSYGLHLPQHGIKNGCWELQTSQVWSSQQKEAAFPQRSNRKILGGALMDLFWIIWGK